MDFKQEDFFLRIMTQALLDMDPDKMDPNQMVPDIMNTTHTTPTTPSTPTNKRKIRQGHGRYDSPGVSSPAESTNTSSNLNSPASATPKVKRARKLATGSSTENQLKQMFSSPQVADQQVSAQPQYLDVNQSAQDQQAGYPQQSPLRQASAFQPQLTRVDQQDQYQQAGYLQQSPLRQASAPPSQVLGVNQQIENWQRNIFEQVSIPQPQYLGAGQQAQPQQVGNLQQSPFHRTSASQSPFSGVNQQAQPQQVGTLQQSPFQRTSASQSPFSGANQQAYSPPIRHPQQLRSKEAPAPQFPTVNRQSQQQQMENLQSVLPHQILISQPQNFGENQRAQHYRQMENLQHQQMPSKSSQSRVPGVTVQVQPRRFEHQQAQEQHVQHQQVQDSHQQIQHQAAQTLNQAGGDSNLFLRQQIIGIDTAAVTYQEAHREPVVKLVSLSGIDVLPIPSTRTDPIDLTMSNGKQYRQGSSHLHPDQAFTREVPFFQIVLFVDGKAKLESCRSYHGPADNEVSGSFKCLRDMHERVSRSLWLKLGVEKAVGSGLQHMQQQQQQQEFGGGFKGNGDMGGGQFDGGFEGVGDMNGGGVLGGEAAFGGEGDAGVGAIERDFSSYCDDLARSAGLTTESYETGWFVRDEKPGEIAR
ncbi:hypothetical protein EG327_009722 [Venturia inaequalis]|uniref:Uncharacterized protein n=1 Tax=Venturia inaequalis TaxID=5025 RepID=A0A8H3VSU5_VENIN|nr:hypothetical protein EG327_009722 [Venturia inaequalis]